MDAGSGAKYSVPVDIISSIKELNLPIIIGGGINLAIGAESVLINCLAARFMVGKSFIIFVVGQVQLRPENCCVTLKIVSSQKAKKISLSR